MFITLSLLAAFLWAVVSHLDKYLLDRVVKNREIGALLIFSGLIGIPLCLCLYLFDNSVLKVEIIPALLTTFSGVCYLVAIYFYLRALSIDEASFVMPFGFFIPLFGSILAFVFMGETLYPTQISGVLFIVLGSIFLNLYGKKKFNPGLNLSVTILMCLASFFSAISSFIFKYANIEGLSFWHAIFWEHIGYILFALIILIFNNTFRNQFTLLIRKNGSIIILLNIVSELITFTGNYSFLYSTLLVNLVVAQLLSEGFQPVFVLIISILFSIFLPKINKEDLNLKTIFFRFSAVLTMLVGVYLVG